MLRPHEKFHKIGGQVSENKKDKTQRDILLLLLGYFIQFFSFFQTTSIFLARKSIQKLPIAVMSFLTHHSPQHFHKGVEPIMAVLHSVHEKG